MLFIQTRNKAIKYFIYALPLIEIFLFILVSAWIGVLWTLLLIVLTTLLGFFLLKKQQVSMQQYMQMSMQFGGSSPSPMFDMMGNSVTMMAGFLLILPGFATDLIGLLCLIPWIRSRLLKSIFGINNIHHAASASNDPHTFDGECWHEQDQLPPKK